jgi:serine-protein kinase ATM
MKIKQAQSTSNPRQSNHAAQSGVPSALTGAAFKFAVGFDLSAGTADEAADRALSAVGRKLDKTLSVEFTVNELISEATDVSNLANMYFGTSQYVVCRSLR